MMIAFLLFWIPGLFADDTEILPRPSKFKKIAKAVADEIKELSPVVAAGMISAGTAALVANALSKNGKIDPRLITAIAAGVSTATFVETDKVMDWAREKFGNSPPEFHRKLLSDDGNSTDAWVNGINQLPNPPQQGCCPGCQANACNFNAAKEEIQESPLEESIDPLPKVVVTEAEIAASEVIPPEVTVPKINRYMTKPRPGRRQHVHTGKGCCGPNSENWGFQKKTGLEVLDEPF